MRSEGYGERSRDGGPDLVAVVEHLVAAKLLELLELAAGDVTGFKLELALHPTRQGHALTRDEVQRQARLFLEDWVHGL